MVADELLASAEFSLPPGYREVGRGASQFAGQTLLEVAGPFPAWLPSGVELSATVTQLDDRWEWQWRLLHGNSDDLVGEPISMPRVLA